MTKTTFTTFKSTEEALLDVNKRLNDFVDYFNELQDKALECIIDLSVRVKSLEYKVKELEKKNA